MLFLLAFKLITFWLIVCQKAYFLSEQIKHIDFLGAGATFDFTFFDNSKVAMLDW